jgi:hypothetical protein
MSDRFATIVRRVLFAAAFVLAVLAVADWSLGLGGWTITVLMRFPHSRLLEYAAIAIVFVIALELREIRRLTRGRGPAL